MIVLTACFLMFGVLIYYTNSYLAKILRMRLCWTAICLYIIYYMISGHMWNRIQRPPYSSGRDVALSIAPQFSFQFQVETHLVGALYFLCGLSMSVLVQKAPYVENERRQRMLVYGCIATFLGIFSLIFRIFLIKNPYYPFKLL
jgi:hypothetical protein